MSQLLNSNDTVLMQPGELQTFLNSSYNFRRDLCVRNIARNIRRGLQVARMGQSRLSRNDYVVRRYPLEWDIFSPNHCMYFCYVFWEPEMFCFYLLPVLCHDMFLMLGDFGYTWLCIWKQRFFKLERTGKTNLMVSCNNGGEYPF